MNLCLDRLDRLTLLTDREQVVLTHLQDGLTAAEIAGAEYVTVATVRSQIRSVLMKLGVRSQLAAVALANQRQPRCTTCLNPVTS